MSNMKTRLERLESSSASADKQTVVVFDNEPAPKDTPDDALIIRIVQG